MEESDGVSMNQLQKDLAGLVARIRKEIMEFQATHEVEVNSVTLHRVDTTTIGNGISSYLSHVVCEGIAKGTSGNS